MDSSASYKGCKATKNHTSRDLSKHGRVLRPLLFLSLHKIQGGNSNFLRRLWESFTRLEKLPGSNSFPVRFGCRFDLRARRLLGTYGTSLCSAEIHAMSRTERTLPRFHMRSAPCSTRNQNNALACPIQMRASTFFTRVLLRAKLKELLPFL